MVFYPITWKYSEMWCGKLLAVSQAPTLTHRRALFTQVHDQEGTGAKTLWDEEF